MNAKKLLEDLENRHLELTKDINREREAIKKLSDPDRLIITEELQTAKYRMVQLIAKREELAEIIKKIYKEDKRP